MKIYIIMLDTAQGATPFRAFTTEADANKYGEKVLEGEWWWVIEIPLEES